jgi:hypothetical protein
MGRRSLGAVALLLVAGVVALGILLIPKGHSHHQAAMSSPPASSSATSPAPAPTVGPVQPTTVAPPTKPLPAPSSDAPVDVTSKLVEFLQTYYSQQANESPEHYKSRIEALVPDTIPASILAERQLDLTLTDLPKDYFLDSLVDLDQMQVQALRTAGEIYITVPVDVTEHSSAGTDTDPIVFNTDTQWKQTGGDTWTMIHFVGLQQGTGP